MQSTLSGIVDLDRCSDISLYRQLYEQLRAAILAGGLPAGTRVPPSRAMAEELAVSRNTVLAALQQLTGEGYLEARHGSATVVSERLSEDLTGSVRLAETRTPRHHRLSRTGQRLAGIGRGRLSRSAPRPFQSGTPDIAAFPHDLWARLLRRASRRLHKGAAAYAHTDGVPELRAVLAHHLRENRGVRAEPGQIIVTSSAQAALDLIARAMIDPGDPVWIEDPGYLGARGAFAGAGGRLIPVAVDRDGLKPRACLPRPRLIYVTPSHQYPTGRLMPLARRLELLDQAEAMDAYILEDDYDSEFQFRGRPVAALQGLDAGESVLYLGTFSKTMYPGLRVGYVIVPPALVDPIARLQRNTGQLAPAMVQLAIAEFIQEGHYRAHIRRTCLAYRERRDALVSSLRSSFSSSVDVNEPIGGMQLVAGLPVGSNDVAMVERLAGHGIEAQAVSRLYLAPEKKPGLFLGFAAWSPETIERQVAAMAEALVL